MSRLPTAPRPTVRHCQQAGAVRLGQHGVETPALDSALLLAHALGQQRSWLYAHPEYLLSDREAALWRSCLAQRQARRPLAYIVGRKEFMGLEFRVDERVLIPRPETELAVELAQDWLQHHPATRIADVGTGSGCIALAIAHRYPELQVYALEASAAALQVARRNARRLGVQDRVRFRQGDLLAPLPAPVCLILANLPYVTAAEHARLAPEIREYEPPSALISGQAGLDHLQRLVAQLDRGLREGGSVILECSAPAARTVQDLLVRTDRFDTVQVHADLAGRDRCVFGQGYHPLPSEVRNDGFARRHRPAHPQKGRPAAE